MESLDKNLPSSSESSSLPEIPVPIDSEEYEKDLWPQIKQALDQLLLTKSGEYIPISYEKVYSCIIKSVASGHSDVLTEDLIKNSTLYLNNLHLQLINNQYDPVSYIIVFDKHLQQFLTSAQAISCVFTYLNRCYLEKLKKTKVLSILTDLFCSLVADKHINTIIAVICELQQRPFLIQPSTYQSLVKNLYLIKPEFSQLRPSLFSQYIPNILPTSSIQDLDHYIREVKQMKRDLLTHPVFICGDQSKKRHYSEEPSVVHGDLQAQTSPLFPFK